MQNNNIATDIISVIFNYCNVISMYKIRLINKKFDTLYKKYYKFCKKKYNIDDIFENLHDNVNINWAIFKKNIIMKNINWNIISKCKKININFIDTFQNMINWNLYVMWNSLNTIIIKKYKHKIDWEIATIYQPLIILMDNYIKEFIFYDLLFLNKDYNPQIGCET